MLQGVLATRPACRPCRCEAQQPAPQHGGRLELHTHVFGDELEALMDADSRSHRNLHCHQTQSPAGSITRKKWVPRPARFSASCAKRWIEVLLHPLFRCPILELQKRKARNAPHSPTMCQCTPSCLHWAELDLSCQSPVPLRVEGASQRCLHGALTSARTVPSSVQSALGKEPC